MITGFACGCFDMFHIGHLNLIRRAREQCDKLIIGLNSDELMFSYKQKYPIIGPSAIPNAKSIMS
jgi:glycerol-3-phosphate cytidylyltransferase